jgi:hypothetical protein
MSISNDRAILILDAAIAVDSGNQQETGEVRIQGKRKESVKI